MQWLADKRNNIVHKGELDWDETLQMIRKGQELLQFTGKLFLEITRSLEFFTKLEGELLSGKEPNWGDIALANLDSAARYFDSDVKIALQIAYETFNLALRNFADSWELPGSDSLGLEEIKEALENEIFDSWENNVGVYYYLPENREDGNEYQPKKFWFKEHITISSVSPGKDEQETVRDFLDHVRFAVIRYIQDSPEPAFLSCFRENLKNGNIKSAWFALSPELKGIIDYQKEKLEFKFSWRSGILSVFLYPNNLKIKEKHCSQLTQVIEELCGDKLHRHKLHIRPPVNWIL